MRNLLPSLPSGIALALLTTIGVASAQAIPPSPVAPAGASASDRALGTTIIELYDADQALLADLAAARKDQRFNDSFLAYRTQVSTTQHLDNFGDPALYGLWAHDPSAPAIVRRAVEFRAATDARLRTIVERNGWPRRQDVGDQAAASFFFLFGHADDDNPWRLTQLSTIERVFREDHVTPRLYAHLRDRLADVAGKPQVYGSIMGPDKTPGSARLYSPLEGDIASADARRAAIGLPSIESDLATFRRGADIGPYMMPMTKGMKWTLADVYSSPFPAPARAAADRP